MTHICVGYLTIIGSDNGLSPGRHQAIIWITAGILLIGPLGVNFSEILIEIKTFSFKKMRLKVSSAKRRPFCLGLNVLRHGWVITCHIKQWMRLPIHAPVSVNCVLWKRPRGEGVLTLNMLNCFKDYERCIHILNRILDLAGPKWVKLTLEQQHMLSVLHSQYHACWYSGDFRSQSISRHDIDPQSRNVSSPASEELMLTQFSWLHSLYWCCMETIVCLTKRALADIL